MQPLQSGQFYLNNWKNDLHTYSTANQCKSISYIIAQYKTICYFPIVIFPQKAEGLAAVQSNIPYVSFSLVSACASDSRKLP